jgi:hypothetical protein
MGDRSAAETVSQPDDIARLQYLYREAINRTYEEPATHTVTAGSEAQPRARSGDVPARQRENNAFLERLRDRLRRAGMSGAQIDQLATAEMKAPAQRFLSKRTTAILVIHGIGEQNPYETLDQFGRNLLRYLAFEGGIDDLEISVDRYDHNDSTEARVRLRTEKYGPQAGDSPTEARPAFIDIYEYYWAPATEDKISYLDTLSWLIKTTLTPIRLLSQNIEVLEGESDEPLSKGAIFRREFLRILFIYFPFLVVLGTLTYLLPRATQWSDVIKTLKPLVSSPTTIAMSGFFAASLILNYVVAKQLWRNWLRRVRQQSAIFRAGWVWGTFATGIFLALIGYAIGRFNLFGKADLTAYFDLLLHWKVVLLLLAAGAARLVQRFLKDFVGDVAVYTNPDAKAKNFAVRKAILNGAVAAATRLLRGSSTEKKDENTEKKDENYDQVIIAGHSLGSVIAYDAINQLLNKKESRPDQIVGYLPQKTEIDQNDLDRICGLVTFGSPLDKVYYFFRQNVPEQQAIRAQILQFLQSFKKRHSGADYGIYRFQPYAFTGFRNIQWLNAWSKQDPISGALHFYTGLTRRHFTYAIPIYAHLSYWEDLRFYEFFAEPLLLGNRQTLRYKVAAGAAV